MPSSIGQFLAALHRIVPAHRAAEWDVSGLQLGDPDRVVARVGVCHEVTEEVVAAVEARPVDLLVTYHPLLFTPTNRLVAGRSPAGRVLRLWAAGVAVAVAHTGFDAAEGGTGDALVAALGLAGCGGFGPVVPAGQVEVVTFLPAKSVESVAAAMSAAGAGVIGNYSGCSFRAEGIGVFTADEGSAPVVGSTGPNERPEIRLEMIAPRARVDEVIAALSAAHPYEQPAYNVGEVRSNVGLIGRMGEPSAPLGLAELAARVVSALGSEGLRVSGPERPIRKVAVVPGSGGSFLKAAMATGSDVFVTGDVGHHLVREALDRGLAVIDPGHAPTERPGMTWLLEVVTEVGNAHGAVTVDLVALDPTPWR